MVAMKRVKYFCDKFSLPEEHDFSELYGDSKQPGVG